jgi:hypothetical protein
VEVGSEFLPHDFAQYGPREGQSPTCDARRLIELDRRVNGIHADAVVERTIRMEQQRSGDFGNVGHLRADALIDATPTTGPHSR